MNHTLKVGKFHTFESIESSLLKELFSKMKAGGGKKQTKQQKGYI